jgi:hypothetical protein
MIESSSPFKGMKVKTIRRPIVESPDAGKPFIGGLKRKMSPCCGASIITSGSGIRREICSKCEKPIRENRLG